MDPLLSYSSLIQPKGKDERKTDFDVESFNSQGRAPMDLLSNFLNYVSQQDLAKALTACRELLVYEPKNSMLLDYERSLTELLLKEAEEEEEEEERIRQENGNNGDGDEDDDDDDDDDGDDDDSDSSSDEDEDDNDRHRDDDKSKVFFHAREHQ